MHMSFVIWVERNNTAFSLLPWLLLLVHGHSLTSFIRNNTFINQTRFPPSKSPLVQIMSLVLIPMAMLSILPTARHGLLWHYLLEQSISTHGLCIPPTLFLLDSFLATTAIINGHQVRSWPFLLQPIHVMKWGRSGMIRPQVLRRSYVYNIYIKQGQDLTDLTAFYIKPFSSILF